VKKTNTSVQESTLALLSRRDVAKRHNVSVMTVKRREKEGLLKPLRFNSRLIRHRLADVIAYENAAGGAK